MKITKKTIETAAQDHAINILGEKEFSKNKNAAKSIMEDFKAGIAWASKQHELLVNK